MKYTAIVEVGGVTHVVDFESGAMTMKGVVRTAKQRASEWSLFNAEGGYFTPAEVEEVHVYERK